jgi:hypothetical protein
MKIISFDVGMKNLAFCLFDINDSNNYSILKWDVLNLCDETDKCKCNFDINSDNKENKNNKKNNKKNNNKNKNILQSLKIKSDNDCISENDYTNEIKLCNAQAKYKKENKYYCKKHASQSSYKIPPANCDDKKLSKKKISELHELIKTYNMEIQENVKYSKFQLIEIIKKQLHNNFLENIVSVRADEISLVTLGKNMMNELNHIFDELFGKDKIEIDVVIIENQISTIASRMKTLQGMISQYFIMRNIFCIDFISSVNKLKIINSSNVKTSYSERKSKGIEVCKKILNDNKQFENNKNSLDKNKKKDDLADCFLQGIYYLKLKDLIVIHDLHLNKDSIKITNNIFEDNEIEDNEIEDNEIEEKIKEEV